MKSYRTFKSSRGVLDIKSLVTLYRVKLSLLLLFNLNKLKSLPFCLSLSFFLFPLFPFLSPTIIIINFAGTFHSFSFFFLTKNFAASRYRQTETLRNFVRECCIRIRGMKKNRDKKEDRQFAREGANTEYEIFTLFSGYEICQFSATKVSRASMHTP